MNFVVHASVKRSRFTHEGERHSAERSTVLYELMAGCLGTACRTGLDARVLAWPLALGRPDWGQVRPLRLRWTLRRPVWQR